MKILERYCPPTDKPGKRLYFVDEVSGAYCSGSGPDPKGSASGCPVCGWRWRSFGHPASGGLPPVLRVRAANG